MKYLLVLIIAISIVASAMPAFAADKPVTTEKSVFQIVGDTISQGKNALPAKDQIRPIKSMAIFQNIADGIKEGSVKAKDKSLRSK
ncbi:MAG: hypothetical protein A2Z72_01760 [Omnitrophica bacterium RBG_13_46_9]|nr:MAG: hypothetical protein A2Z72_01760 [Omnitrophica bacterium RBG_13_46_9]